MLMQESVWQAGGHGQIFALLVVSWMSCGTISQFAVGRVRIYAVMGTL